MARKRIDIDINQIKTLYVDQKKSLRETARILGSTVGTIKDRMKENGLNIRSKSEGQKLIGGSRATRKRIDIDLSKIVRMYFEQELSLTEVGKRFGVSQAPIRERLISAGYKLRPPRKRKTIPELSTAGVQSVEARLQKLDAPKQIDLSRVPVGSLKDRIIFMRDTLNAKIQDIAHTLEISTVEVYQTITDYTSITQK